MNSDALSKALMILKALLTNEYGYIESSGADRNLFVYYLESDVQNVLELVSEELGLNIFKVQDRIYMSPREESFLSVSESDVARYFYISKEREILEDSRIRLNLFYYTVLNFLSIIYSGYPAKKTQDYTTLGEIVSVIDRSVERALVNFNEEKETEAGFNILKSCSAWNSFTREAEGNAELNSKTGFVRRSMAYLKKQGLVKTSDDTEYRIYPERKLTDLMANGGLNMERIRELKINMQNQYFYERGNVVAYS